MSTKTKHKQGYTQLEIRQLALDNNIDEDRLDKEIGIVTGLMINDEIVLFHDDVDRAVRRILTGKKQSHWEWD